MGRVGEVGLGFFFFSFFFFLFVLLAVEQLPIYLFHHLPNPP